MSAQPARRHLQLVDGETGEIVDSRELGAMQHELEELRTKFKMAQRDVAAKNLRIAALETDKARERLDYERYADVERIARYWHRKVHGGSRRVNPMSPDRFDAVRGILDQEEIIWEEPAPGKKRRTKRREPMYSMEDCKAAVDGCAFDHFVKKRRNGSEQHFTDLEFIFRNSKNFEECRDRCPEHLAPRTVTRDTTREGSKQPPPSAVRSEVQHGQRVMGSARGRVAVRVEEARHPVRGRVAPRDGGASASWA